MKKTRFKAIILLVFCLCLWGDCLLAQIILHPAQGIPRKNITQENESFDFECGKCVQKWQVYKPITPIAAIPRPSCSPIGGNPELLVSPNSSINLIFQFTDVDLYFFKGSCDTLKTDTAIVTPHRVLFTIIAGSNIASFDPTNMNKDTMSVISRQISTDGLLQSESIPIYISSAATAGDKVEVKVDIFDDIATEYITATGVDELRGSLNDPTAYGIYTYEFEINDLEPMAMKRTINTPNDIWSPFTGTKCYEYELVNTCIPTVNPPNFDDITVTEELFDSNILFQSSDIKLTWLVDQGLNPTGSESALMIGITEKLFPLGTTGTPVSWRICGNKITDCHGMAMVLTDGDSATDIFKATALMNNKAGYCLSQRFRNGSGATIGEAKITRVIRQQFGTNLYLNYIRKEHTICN